MEYIFYIIESNIEAKNQLKELRRQNVICSDIVYNRVGHLLYINVLREIVLTQSGGLKEKNGGTNAASAAS